MDDLQAMAVFAAVVQQGSMSGAARQLGMTPSAVSQRVRALEGAHRVTLLHHSTRRLTLIEVGQRVFAHCESLLRSADSAREQMQLARNVLALVYHVIYVRPARRPALGSGARAAN